MSGIRIKARIKLLPPADGGRTKPIRGSYRPNHNFGDSENRVMATGFLNFSEGEMLSPGDSTEMELTFWPYPGLAALVVTGRQWRIQEGAKLVGTGEILEVLGYGVSLLRLRCQFTK